MTVRYLYTESDPRENRAHYMYSPFEGRNLFVGYREDRHRLLENSSPGVAAHYEKLIVNLMSSAAVEPSAPATRDYTDERRIDTESLLYKCVDDIVTGQFKWYWAEFFQRKVEVARYIRQSYGPDRKPNGLALASAEAHCLLAYVLAYCVSRSPIPVRFKWLNALLKLTDTVSACRLSATEPFSEASLRAAVTYELTVIDGELVRHGIGSLREFAD